MESLLTMGALLLLAFVGGAAVGAVVTAHVIARAAWKRRAEGRWVDGPGGVRMKIRPVNEARVMEKLLGLRSGSGRVMREALRDHLVSSFRCHVRPNPRRAHERGRGA